MTTMLGRWKTGYFCVNCNAEMTYNCMMYSGGTCPACGNNDPGAVVDCQSRGYRWVYEVIKWKGVPVWVRRIRREFRRKNYGE